MTEKKAIRYLSLAAKAGRLVTGADECEKALKRKKGNLIVLAADAAANTRKHADNLSRDSGVSLTQTEYTKSELAAAVGRGSSVALALVTDEGLAKAFLAEAIPQRQEERI